MKTGTLLRAVLTIFIPLLLTMLPAGSAAHAAMMPMSSTVVISQLYGGAGGAGSVFTTDYVELFNRSAAPVDLDGWSIQSARVGSANWSVIPLDGTLEAGHYYLVQLGNADETSNLPAPDAQGAAALDADGGKVTLVRDSAALGEFCPSDNLNVVDLVGYGDVTCAEASPTLHMGASTALVRRDAGCTESDHNANDFAVGAPDPHNRMAPAEDCRGPIVLVSFTMQNERDYIDIRWETSFEEETRGFNLYRGTDTTQGTIRINPAEIPAHGGPGQINRYSHPDYDVEEHVTYYYFLEEVSLTGQRTVIGIQSILRESPSAVALQSFESNAAPGGVAVAGLAAVGAVLAAGWVWRRRR